MIFLELFYERVRNTFGLFCGNGIFFRPQRGWRRLKGESSTSARVWRSYDKFRQKPCILECFERINSNMRRPKKCEADISVHTVAVYYATVMSKMETAIPS